MSYLPDSASFHERVQDCFVAYRGRGLSLSPKDVDLLDAWAEKQVPFEVVARGIRRAAESVAIDAAEGDSLNSLRACRRHVDAEIQKFVKRAVGAGGSADEQPLHLARHAKLTSALKKFAREQPAFRSVLAVVKDLKPPDDLAGADRQEHLVLALIVRRMTFADRLSLLKRARRALASSMPASRNARLDSLRFHRSAHLRQAVEVPTFW